tara:strand:+ start:942 stop:1181 length:240 start_codon:yes stop_codon:yes gene_type:complete
VSNAALALFLVVVMWYGEVYLTYCPGKDYSCPSYCSIDHIHLTEDCNENKEQQEAYEQGYAADSTASSIQLDGNTIASR